MIRTLGVKLTADPADLRSGLQAASRSVGGFTSEFSRAFDVIGSRATLTAGLVVAGMFALVKGFRSTVEPAIEFEVQMRNANSIMHESEGTFRATSDAVLDMSRKLPQSADTLAKGLYDVASAGFYGKDGLTVLHAAAIAASAGMTDTATSAKAITAVLRAYGLQARDAGAVSDALFQTVNLGIVTFEELAQGLGDVVGIAAAAKVSINDVGAAVAAITLAGVPAAEATTSLNRILQSIIEPGENLATVFHSWGYESGLAALQALGLHGVMERLRVSTGGNVASLLALFPEIRAARAAFALSAAEGKNYAQTQAQIGDANAAAGATQRAFNEQMKATGNRLKVAGNDAAAFGINIGRSVLPAANLLVTALGGVVHVGERVTRFLSENRAILLILASVVGAALVPALVSLIARFAAWLAYMTIARPLIAILTGEITLMGTAMMAAGAAALIGAGVIIKALNDSKAAALGYVETLQQGLDLSSFQDQAQYVDRLRNSLTDLLDTRELVGDTGSPVSGLLNKDIRDATATVDKLGEEMEKTSIARLNFAANIQEIAHVTGTHGTGTFKRLSDFAKLAGVDLSKDLASSKGERQKLINYMQDLSGSTGLTIDQITALGPAVIQSMTEAEDAATKAASSLKDFFGLFSGFKFPDQAEAAKTAQDAADKLADAEERLAEAQDRVKDNLRHITRTEQLNRDLAKDRRDVAKAERELADARKASNDAASKAKQDPQQAVQAQYAKQIKDFTQFLNDIDKAIAMGLDPEFALRAMMDPDTYAPLIHAIVSTRQGRATISTINKSEAKLRDLGSRAQAIIQMLNSAVAQGIHELNQVLVKGIHDALTTPDISKLNGLAWQVGAALRGAFIDGVQGKKEAPNLQGKPKPGQPTPGISATPGISVASGGVFPHVQNEGRHYIYAEPGTGGEAFIPLGSSSRGRSVNLLRQVAELFGFGLVPRGAASHSAASGIGMTDQDRFLNDPNYRPADPVPNALLPKRFLYSLPMQRGGVMVEGGNTGASSYSKSTTYALNGPIHFPSARELEAHLDRKVRLAALAGGSNG